ncbi:MAG: lysophospholipid acyltransferase family protein [Pseudomonadota bacterium]
MQERLDPLIAERAPWLFGETPWRRTARAGLNRVLGYDRTVELAETLRDLPGDAIMARMAQLLAKELQVSGLQNIPRQGPAMIVANHPTGIADGIMMDALLRPIRPDLYFYANVDILRVLPQMDSMIAPVEWRMDKRTHSKTRATMAYTRKAVADGRLGVIFPSGRLAKRKGLRLHERPWMTSAAMLARKYDLPVIPVNIRARNSALFYFFDVVHPTLRDITLFHETLNKDRQPFRLTVGEPISPKALPARSDAATEILKRATLGLGGEDGTTVSLVRASRRPSWV